MSLEFLFVPSQLLFHFMYTAVDRRHYTTRLMRSNKILSMFNRDPNFHLWGIFVFQVNRNAGCRQPLKNPR